MPNLSISAVVVTAGFDQIIRSKGRLKDVLLKAAHDVEGKGKQIAIQKKVFDTGATVNSIQVFDDNIENLEVTIGPTTDYAPHNEFGTIFMAARPFMTPAVTSVRGNFERAVKMVIDG
jgi:HK97 gp10 family phage protein